MADSTYKAALNDFPELVIERCGRPLPCLRVIEVVRVLYRNPFAALAFDQRHQSIWFVLPGVVLSYGALIGLSVSGRSDGR